MICLSCTCLPVEAGGGKKEGPGEGTFVDWLELLTLWPGLAIFAVTGALRGVRGYCQGLRLPGDFMVGLPTLPTAASSHCGTHSWGKASVACWPVTQGHLS